jgi:hypothetical protein
VRAPSTNWLLLLLGAIAFVGGCLDVTPYPIVDSGSACDQPLEDGGCGEPDAQSDTSSAADGGSE